MRKLSFAVSDMKDEDYDKEWQKKVTECRSNMQDLGDFKHRNKTFKQIRTAVPLA